MNTYEGKERFCYICNKSMTYVYVCKDCSKNRYKMYEEVMAWVLDNKNIPVRYSQSDPLYKYADPDLRMDDGL